MAISIEGYMLTNFAMNAVIIGVIARSRGRVRWGRVLFASAFGAIYAVAMECGWYPQLDWIAFKLLLAIGLTLVAVRVDSVKELATGTLLLIGGTVFVGGVTSLLVSLAGRSTWTLALGALVGCAALVAALEARGRKLERWEAQVHIKRRGRTVRLTALIDTGNRLHEPISGLPVMIVEERIVEKLLPPLLDVRHPEKYLPPGFRLVAYGALGGAGQMACFQPDELLVSYGDGWMRAPDVWVAVYPGRIPGASSALAPTVIGRIQSAKVKTSIKSAEGSRYRWSIPHSKS